MGKYTKALVAAAVLAVVTVLRLIGVEIAGATEIVAAAATTVAVYLAPNRE